MQQGQAGQQQRIQSGNRAGGITGWVNRGNMGNNIRARGRGGRQPGTNQQHFNRAPGTGQGQQQIGGNKKTTLKFEGDYDFDKANTEFEELRSQLSKVKISKINFSYDNNKVLMFKSKNAYLSINCM